MSQPPSNNPFQGSGQPPQPASEGVATGGLIPYKNMNALVSYYLGIASLIPCIGFFTGIVAVVLGIMGLQKRKANPAIKGAAHAWIGIILGGFGVLVYGGIMVLGIIGAATAN